jgi:hypothetical protein
VAGRAHGVRELLATVERKEITDPAALARAVVKDRKEDQRSWGWIAARYRITEDTARAVYAAAGEDWKALDYRRKADKPEPPVAA